ncbi:MAG: ammonium transporter, partial [Desulfovibrio sp.]|nr:ammonium transporter [Desulfovibrio sp.]
MFKNIFLALTLALVVLAGTATCFAGDPPKPDPSGLTIGTAADVVNATAGAPTAEDMEKMAASEPLAVKLADVVG